MKHLYAIYDFEDVSFVVYDIPDIGNLLNRFNKIIDNKPIVSGDFKTKIKTSSPIKHLQMMNRSIRTKDFFLKEYKEHKKWMDSMKSVSFSGTFGMESLFDNAEDYANHMVEGEKRVISMNKKLNKLIKDFEAAQLESKI